jgi:hypothetical protein
MTLFISVKFNSISKEEEIEIIVHEKRNREHNQRELEIRLMQTSPSSSP